MVQIIPAANRKRSFASEAGSALGQGFNESFAESFSDARKLKKENEALKKRGIDVEGMTGDTRAQVIAHELQYGKKKNTAESTRGFFANENPEIKGQMQEPKKGLPEFLNKESNQQIVNKDNIASFKERNIPTYAARERVLSPQEEIQQGSRFAKMSTENGNPMSDEQGIAIVHGMNEDKKAYNQEQMNLEKHYGDIGEGALTSYFKNPSPEIATMFRKKGEEAFRDGSGRSEAEIQKDLVKQAIELKNIIANVEKSIKPDRLLANLGRHIQGNRKSHEKFQTELKNNLKPLLEMGLYDEARALLSKGGLAREETENAITELSETTKKELSQFPKMIKEIPNKMEPRKRAGLGGWGSVVQKANENQAAENSPYTPDQIAQIDNTVENIFKKDPNTNLILLRKQFEDKNVNWEAYKDAINKGVLEGYIDISDPERNNQYTDLQEPPLGDLDKMMYNVKLLGR